MKIISQNHTYYRPKKSKKYPKIRRNSRNIIDLRGGEDSSEYDLCFRQRRSPVLIFSREILEILMKIFNTWTTIFENWTNIFKISRDINEIWTMRFLSRYQNILDLD